MKNSTKFYWKMILSSIIRRKSRMFTAILAIAMGATILSGLVTIYYDIPRQLGKEFRAYGANMIILPNDSLGKIEEKQIKEIKEIVPNDKMIGFAPYIYTNVRVNEQPHIVAATDMKELKNNSPYWLVDGEWPTVAREVMIGHEISKKFDLKIGDTVLLNIPKQKLSSDKEKTDAVEKDQKADATISFDNNYEFTVTSIVTTGGKEEELIFMSLDDIRGIKGKLPIDVVECSIDAEASELGLISEEIRQKDSSLNARLVKRVTESQDVVLGKLQTLVWIVTAIVLFIMMICVGTTMMAVVAERRKEIGLKKALGANNKSVVMDFLGEGIVLGISGGLLGVLFGYLFAGTVSISVFARKVHFLVGLAPITVLVSVIITVIACLIPVRTAVDVEPALVLKGE